MTMMTVFYVFCCMYALYMCEPLTHFSYCMSVEILYRLLDDPNKSDFINQTVHDYVPLVLPYYSILLNRTPALYFTGFKSVVVVLNTSPGPSACTKGF